MNSAKCFFGGAGIRRAGVSGGGGVNARHGKLTILTFTKSIFHYYDYNIPLYIHNHCDL